MSSQRTPLLVFSAALVAIAACGRDPDAHADTTAGEVSSTGRSWRDSVAGFVARGVVAADTPPVQQAKPDSTRAATDSVAIDSTKTDSTAAKDTTRPPAINVTMAPGRPKKDSISLATTIRFFNRKAGWPVSGPAPADGALLPNKRIIAFYGNPLSKRMGILGELPPEQMLAKLDSTVKEW